jgi:adenylate cyclase
MISQASYEQAKDEIIVRELDLLRVKGKKRAVTVFELAGLSEDGANSNRDRLFEAFAEGIEAYRARRWREAGMCFAAALDIDPEDGPSQAYLDRSRHFRDNPPEEDWDSSFTLTGK